MRTGSLIIACSLAMSAIAPAALQIHAIAKPGEPARLLGPDATLQLVVTDSEGVDATRTAQLRAEPDGLVAISQSGQVTPLANGQATVIATAADGSDTQIQVAVEQVETPQPINFPNEVVPLFTKHGCNGGGCHGKSGGQNGFRLSLLGFGPRDDYEYLVQESRGRRLFPAAPEHSLLLRTAPGELPHGGGSRFERDSWDYKALVRWMEQGMPYGLSLIHI